MLKLERPTTPPTLSPGWAPPAPAAEPAKARAPAEAVDALPPRRGLDLGAAPRVSPSAVGSAAPTTVRVWSAPSAATSSPPQEVPSVSLTDTRIGLAVEGVIAAVGQAAATLRRAAERARAGDPAPAHEAADALGAELRVAMRSFLASRPLLSSEETYALKGLVRALDGARTRLEADQRRILGARRASSLDLSGELVDALRVVARQAARRVEITEGQAGPARDVSTIVEQGRARAVAEGYAPTSLAASAGFVLQDVVHHAEIEALAGYLLDLGRAQPAPAGAHDPAAHALSFARGLVSQYGRGDRAIDDVWYAALDTQHAARARAAAPA